VTLDERIDVRSEVWMRRVRGVAALLTLAGCSVVFLRNPVTPGEVRVATAVAGDSEWAPVVQVRTYPYASSVSIVGWSPDDDDVGLRASLRRDGTPYGNYKVGDHQLYVSAILVQNMGGFIHASVVPGRYLPRAARLRDYDACRYGKECSPQSTVGLSMSDSILRAAPDSLVVRFQRTVGEDWTVTLRHDLIVAYLGVVDSVSGRLKKGAP